MNPVNTKKPDKLGKSDFADEIFCEHGDFIRAVINRGVKDKALAEDVFQDFFVSIISEPLPREICYIRSYLYRLITNDIVDTTRQKKKYRQRLQRYTARNDPAAFEDSPVSILIAKEETEKVFDLVSRQLPKRESQAVTLRYKNDYNTKEIAKKMRVNSKSASRYISMGLKKLRQILVHATQRD